MTKSTACFICVAGVQTQSSDGAQTWISDAEYEIMSETSKQVMIWCGDKPTRSNTRCSIATITTTSANRMFESSRVVNEEPNQYLMFTSYNYAKSRKWIYHTRNVYGWRYRHRTLLAYVPQLIVTWTLDIHLLSTINGDMDSWSLNKN